MEADWDKQDRPTPDAAAAPVLSTDDFEGPLDWLVEQARARRIDLRRLSVLALIETFETAMLEALDGGASASTIDIQLLSSGALERTWEVMMLD